ncbi:YraN family protein [bacterium]|nr:YraN family protein [bacterium]MCB1222181.1 YraN family protein [bacterium]UNM07981.1 MAG: YraN family protein [Planctomycetales bacterium]
MGSKDFGGLGEELAARLMESQGMEILERNLHIGKLGELDIVALDGETLVFCEVKCKHSNQELGGFHAINFGKQQQVKRLAGAFLVGFEGEFRYCRFDAVEVVVDIEGKAEPVVNQLKDAWR